MTVNFSFIFSIKKKLFLFLILSVVFIFSSVSFIAKANHSCSTDINQDGTTNIFDYTLLSANFFQKGDIPEDIDHSGMVDLFDYSLLASNFFSDCSIIDPSPTPQTPSPTPTSETTLRGPLSNPAIPFGAIYVSPGESIQSAIDSNPSGTVIVLKSGLYRGQTFTPKDNNVIIGEFGARLVGSEVLTNFTKEGSYWVISGRSESPDTSTDATNVCESTHPRCIMPQDLIINNEPLEHVTDLAQVTSGKWFFDYQNDKVYFADDPTDKVVELSTVSVAIVGVSDNVELRNLIIEKYATPYQRGAVEVYGSNWVVENNLFQLNHAKGLKLEDEILVSKNIIDKNGCVGAGGSANAVTIVNNEVSNNNYSYCKLSWEAGGIKLTKSDGSTISDNYFHHNIGNGFWSDIDNINLLIENNIFEYNTRGGVEHEIGYKAIIRNNTLKYNGSASGGYLNRAQIYIANSQDVEVYDNYVESGMDFGFGIAIWQSDRGDGLYGPRVSRNNYVHHNTIVLHSVISLTGLDATGDKSYIDPASNKFDYNTYKVNDISKYYFKWDDNNNWEKFRAKGNEPNGTIEQL